MDLEKLLKLAASYASNYVRTFAALWSPGFASPRTATLRSDGTLQVPDPEDSDEELLAVVAFALISMAIGIPLAALSQRLGVIDYYRVGVYIAASWILFSAYVYLLIHRIARVKLPLAQAMRACTYCIAETFVLASMASVLGTIVLFGLVYLATSLHIAIPLVCYLLTQAVVLPVLLLRNVVPVGTLVGTRRYVFLLLAVVPTLLVNMAVSLRFAQSFFWK